MAAPAYHLTSNGPRANTLVMDMSTIPSRKLNMDIIAKFVNEKLMIAYSDVKTLQHNTGKSLVFVEVASEELAITATEKNGGAHVLSIDQENFKVNVFMEDGATTVRVHDISPQTENKSIAKVLEKYGQVLWLKEEIWTEPTVLKGIKNGIRAVRIKLHTAVPSYVNIGGEVTLVTYKHQQQTCRHCHKPVHWGRKCIEASFMELQVQGGNISERLIASGVNYAGALKTGVSRDTEAGGITQDGERTALINKKKQAKPNEEVGVNFTCLNDLVRKNNSAPQSSVSATSERITRKSSQYTNTSTREHKSRSRSNVRNSRKGVAEVGGDDNSVLIRSMLQSNAYGGLISEDDDIESVREMSDRSMSGKLRNDLGNKNFESILKNK